MTKQLTCPVCGKKKWCRDDAETCSSNCRVTRWRSIKKHLEFISSDSILDSWAETCGLKREAGETDDVLRERIIATLKGGADG